MSERDPISGNEVSRIGLFKAATRGEPVAKLFSDLSLIIGGSYAGAWIFLMTQGRYHEAAVAAFITILDPVTYKKLYERYENLPLSDQERIRKQVLNLPFKPLLNRIDKVLDFPITKRRVRFTTTMPTNVDISKN